MSDTLQQLLDLPPIAEILRNNNLIAKKSLGQHFLPDLNLTAKIVSLSSLNQSEAVLEIGPGPGGLTRMLLAELTRIKSTAPLIAIESDRRCIQALAPLQKIADKQLQIIAAPAEKVDITTILPQKTGASTVVANLPYNVATPILLKLLAHSKLFNQLILMFQAEVAQRICATPNNKDYGRLSVAVQSLCHAEILMEIPPQAFSPPPKVDSAIVRLRPLHNEGRIKKWHHLQDVIRAAFSERRKMIRKSLQNLPPNISKTADQLLLEADIDGRRRAETLTIDEFDRLTSLYQACLTDEES